LVPAPGSLAHIRRHGLNGQYSFRSRCGRSVSSSSSKTSATASIAKLPGVNQMIFHITDQAPARPRGTYLVQADTSSGSWLTSGTQVLTAGSNFEVRVRRFRRDLKNEGGGVFTYFRGSFFQFLGDFSRFGSISSIFGAHFHPFCRFSDLVTRYTRTENPRLMYSSSPTRVKAGQLAPPAYRFVQTVYLGLNPWFPWVGS
jgi:hypothetical protein